MKPEAQRIAIAEACGWANVRVTKLEPTTQSIICGDWRGVRSRVPSYTSDLNAMHEAEKTLDGYMMLKYASELLALTGGAGTAGSFSHIHANAAQRAEAFLKTTGRWEQ